MIMSKMEIIKEIAKKIPVAVEVFKEGANAINEINKKNKKKKQLEMLAIINSIIIGIATVLCCYTGVFFFKEPASIGTIVCYIFIVTINTFLIILNQKIKNKKAMTIISSIYAIIPAIVFILICIYR